MFRILSYANMLIAVTYLLMFPAIGVNVVVPGIFLVLVLNILVAKNIQQGWKKAGLIHYGLGLACLAFAAFLLVGLVHIVRSSIAYNYFSNTLSYIVLTTLLVLCITFHFMFLCFYREEE